MAERQQCRAGVFQSRRFILNHHLAAFGQADIYGPALIQKFPKGCGIGNDDFQRPIFEVRILAQGGNQIIVEQWRNTLFSIVPLAKHFKEVGQTLDQCRFNLEDMA